MQEQELNINEIVKIEKMAVIKQQLDKVESFIDEKVKDIPEVLKQLEEMTDKEKEEKKGEIKKYRTYLNNIKNQLEDKRKEIKTEISKPYDDFNEYYSNGVKIKLEQGIEQLNNVVNDIENKQKEEMENELRTFAQNWFVSKGIENFVKFEDIGLKINVTSTMKNLKQQIITFCEKVFSDIQLIDLEEYKEEILFEYQNTLDFAKSKMLVVNRHSAINAIKNIQDIKQEQEKQEEKIVEKVEEITIPKEIIEDDELLKVTFTIETTKQNILELKKWLNERGIKYGNNND